MKEEEGTQESNEECSEECELKGTNEREKGLHSGAEMDIEVKRVLCKNDFLLFRLEKAE